MVNANKKSNTEIMGFENGADATAMQLGIPVKVDGTATHENHFGIEQSLTISTAHVTVQLRSDSQTTNKPHTAHLKYTAAFVLEAARVAEETSDDEKADSPQPAKPHYSNFFTRTDLVKKAEAKKAETTKPDTKTAGISSTTRSKTGRVKFM